MADAELHGRRVQDHDQPDSDDEPADAQRTPAARPGVAARAGPPRRRRRRLRSERRGGVLRRAGRQPLRSGERP